MNKRLLIADGVDIENGVLTREKASGYKKILVDKSLDGMLVEIKDIEVDGEQVLQFVKADVVDDGKEDEEYVFIAKEIGLAGKAKGIYADITYILCDNNIMVVTLKDGAFFCNIQGRLLMPNINLNTAFSCKPDDIFWIDGEWLKSFHRNVSDDARYAYFTYDFEYRAVVKGELVYTKAIQIGLQDSSYKPCRDGIVDLSRGAFDVWQTREEAKEQLRAAQAIAKSAMQSAMQSANNAYLFDDDDEDVEYEEEDEDDDIYG